MNFLSKKDIKITQARVCKGSGAETNEAADFYLIFPFKIFRWGNFWYWMERWRPERGSVTLVKANTDLQICNSMSRLRTGKKRVYTGWVSVVLSERGLCLGQMVSRSCMGTVPPRGERGKDPSGEGTAPPPKHIGAKNWNRKTIHFWTPSPPTPGVHLCWCLYGAQGRSQGGRGKSPRNRKKLL